MKYAARLAFVVLLCLFTAPVFAGEVQTAAPAPAPAAAPAQAAPADTAPAAKPSTGVDPAAFAMAKEVMRFTHSDEITKQIMPALIKNYSAVLARDNPQKTELISSLLQQYLVPVFEAHLGELEDQIALIYAGNLTVEDMQQVIAFYKTPAGQKYLQVAPAMLQQTIAVAHTWGTNVGKEAAQNLIAALKKNNLAVPKEMGI